MKKIISVLLTITLMLSMAAAAFAGPEDTVPQAGGMLGGWTVYTAEQADETITDETAALPEGESADAPAAEILPEEVRAAFEKAMGNYVGMNFTPLAYLGSQIVAGTNYQILCTGAPVVLQPETGLYVVTVYKDLQGEATILHVVDLDLGKTEETENAGPETEQLSGGWQVPQEVKAAALPEDAASAFSAATEGLMGVSYVPAALLGTKIIAGTEYAFLAHATTVTAEPLSYFAVMFVAANADGSYEVMNIVPLDLADFNTDEAGETAEEEAPAEYMESCAGNTALS